MVLSIWGNGLGEALHRVLVGWEQLRPCVRPQYYLGCEAVGVVRESCALTVRRDDLAVSRR